jgi:DNA-binding MarR family transcriptional regulator
LSHRHMNGHHKKSAQPSDLKAHIGFWLRFVSNHVSQAFAQKLLDSEVTVAEWVILREMFGSVSTSPSSLATSTGLTRGAVSKLVERLLRKKLVTREEGATDRRTQVITLTPEGRRLVPLLASLADQNDEQFFAVLSAKQREELVATLKKLVQANRLNKIPIE